MGKLRTLPFVVLALTFLYACQEDTKTNDNASTDTLAQNDYDDIEEDIDIPSNTTFKLPSPVELYLFLWEEDAKFTSESLNPIENSKKYFTTPKKAINFGVFASDLAYCTVFSKNQETFTYFTTVKSIADEMGLTEGFDEAIATRINENINNADSLYNITATSYESATNFLENQEEGNLLPYILAGAWIESVHIAISSIEKFSENDEIVIRIAEQQFLLENLMDYLKSIERNNDLNKLHKQLKDLQGSFDKLYDNTDVIITKEQYDEITKKVESLRADFIS
ncbi:MAG: hypothetical protein KJ607_11745 [Bacteroidetes bacterium]|nr:hypothetical protein [Bacteroidota bacterium]